MIAAFISVAALALGGAVVLLVWISSMTPIHVSEETVWSGGPPSAAEVVDSGGVLAVLGEVSTVHEPEWTTSDGSRPGTPWDVSGVPDDYWIQSTVTVDLDEAPLILQPDAAENLDVSNDPDELLFVFRGGEIDGDQHEVNDGQKREFEPGERVLLVVTAGDSDTDSPELNETEQGSAWELMRTYSIEPDGTAVLQWGDDEFEHSVDELLDEYRDASQ